MRIRNLLFINVVLCLFFTGPIISPANAYEFPPYQGITLKVTGNISENYNNNITFASDNENRVEDFRTMLNLGLDFNYEGKKRSLAFSGRATRQILESNSDVRNPSENISLTFNNEFTKYDRLTVRNTFSHTQEPGSGQGEFNINECRDYYQNSGLSASQIEVKCNEFAEEFGRFKGRFESYRNDLSFMYNKYLTDFFNISTNYVYGKNWSDEEGTNDSQRNTLGFRANYKFSEATNLSVSYSYQVSNYERGDDISRQSFDVGIKQFITKRLSFNGSIGTNIMSSGTDSMSIESALTGELDEKSSASLSYLQGTEISANQADTFKHWQITGNLQKSLLENLTSNFSAFYGKGDYATEDIIDTLLGASFTILYDFWRNKRGAYINGRLGYSYSKLDSTDEPRGYTRNSVNSSITAAF